MTSPMELPLYGKLKLAETYLAMEKTNEALLEIEDCEQLYKQTECKIDIGEFNQ